MRHEDFLAWFWLDMCRLGRHRCGSAAFADCAIPAAGRILLCQIIRESAPVAG